MTVGFKTPDSRPRPPRELLFECYSKDHVFYRCELVMYPDGAVEAQFIEAPGELRHAHRFTDVGLPSARLTARDQATCWADALRKDIETGRFNP